MDDGLFGKATQSETLEHATPVATQARRIVWSAQGRFWVLALERSAGETSSARAARLRKSPDDVIADAGMRDIRTDCRHDPRDFVTQHRRCRRDVVSGKQQIGVTESRGFHVDEDFASDRRSDVNVLKIKPTTERVQDKRFHSQP